MIKHALMIKETFELVQENEEITEYNMVNPYQRAIESLRDKYPHMKIISTKTLTDVFMELQFPVLSIKYDTEGLCVN